MSKLKSIIKQWGKHWLTSIVKKNPDSFVTFWKVFLLNADSDNFLWNIEYLPSLIW